MIGNRTRAREIALQALYCHDLCHDLPAAELTLRSSEAPADVKQFAHELMLGVLRRLAVIDAAITAAAENWDIERLAVVDRNVLRLAVHEMLDRPDIPPKVSINEAIELGKRYSTAQSGGFVNGILDRIRRDLGIAASAVEGDVGNADRVEDGGVSVLVLESATGAGTGTGAEAEAGAEAGAEAEAEAEAEAGTETGAGTRAGTRAGTETGTETDATATATEAEAGTETETETETETAPVRLGLSRRVVVRMSGRSSEREATAEAGSEGC